MEHKQAERHVVQPGECLGEPLVASRHPAEPNGPTERPHDDPPSRQEHKSSLRFGQLHDLQDDPMTGRRIESVLAGETLIGIPQFHRLTGYPLDRFGQHANLRLRPARYTLRGHKRDIVELLEIQGHQRPQWLDVCGCQTIEGLLDRGLKVGEGWMVAAVE